MDVLTFKKPVSQVDSNNSVENAEAADQKSLFARTDTEILEGIYATHVVCHEHDALNVDSLFSITESILKCSKQIVDHIEQMVCKQILLILFQVMNIKLLMVSYHGSLLIAVAFFGCSLSFDLNSHKIYTMCTYFIWLTC